MRISSRLGFIRSFNQEGSRVIYDIGCDHGELGKSFEGESGIEKIFLIDPSPTVINKLKDSYITKAILSKGQDIILDPLPKTIFIAGMGGKEIQDILETHQSTLTSQDLVIVSPHRKVLELRQWLSTSSLGLVTDAVCFENDQFYPVMVLRKGARKVSLFGDDLWVSEVGRRYRDHLIKHFSIHQDPVSQAFSAHLKSLK